MAEEPTTTAATPGTTTAATPATAPLERARTRRHVRSRAGSAGSRRWRVVAPVVAALCVALASAACMPTSSAPGMAGMAGDAVTALNQDRAGAGLGGLAWDADLARWAQIHAQDLAGSGYLWHSDLGFLLGPTGTWTLGENLLMAPAGTSGGAGEDMWMSSPPHRANILNGSFDRVGLGVATDGAGRLWVVALFGAR